MTRPKFNQFKIHPAIPILEKRVSMRGSAPITNVKDLVEATGTTHLLTLVSRPNADRDWQLSMQTHAATKP